MNTSKDRVLPTQSISSINTIDASFQISFQFPVYFNYDVFDTSNTLVKEVLRGQQDIPQKILVYIDSGITAADPAFLKKAQDYFEFHERDLQLLDEPVVLPGGEAAKKNSEIESLYSHMLTHDLDRHCCVIAIGGGAMLDAVGFACATFHRGIPLIRMSSTVLAQNDAGIGVKNGYNALRCKNLVGSFAPPRAVINDFLLLDTLQTRDKLSGLAETVKVAAIRDATFFNWLEQNTSRLIQFDPEASQYAIARCAQLHLQQITHGGDPFESGSARPLDYGHWSAHKIETLLNYKIRHGEAVAAGMALDARYAFESGLLDETESLRLISLLENLGFELWNDVMTDTDEQDQYLLLQGLEDFRQHLGGELCITLLTSIGSTVDVNTIDHECMMHACDWLKEKHKT